MSTRLDRARALIRLETQRRKVNEEIDLLDKAARDAFVGIELVDALSTISTMAGASLELARRINSD